VPVALPVNVTEQLPEANVQDGALKVPAEPVFVNETVPVGVVVGAGEVSVTVAVQVEAWPTTTGEEHARAVEVVRGLTVMLFEAVGPLVAWTVSPP